jgi:DNA-directed RNA polymerase specialized sigma24 family protein
VVWAQQLVGRNRAAAEDLVHDTFVRVALRKPDLDAIGNLDGYLFVTMRNVHLSQLRRQVTVARSRLALDYESVAAVSRR